MTRLAYDSRAGRRLLVVTVMASGVAFLDASVVTVALPSITADVGGGFTTLQWIVDGYLLTLGSLVLVGGALGDALGQKRVFLWGIVGFAITSALCAVAPTAAALIAARAAQGCAAALLVPGSLALLSSNLREEDRGRAIGAWSGLTSLLTVVGPTLGGLLVDHVPGGWRLIFLINVPLLAIAARLTVSGVPPDKLTAGNRVDFLGGVLACAGLGVTIAFLIEGRNLPTGLTIGGCVTGLALLLVFALHERRCEERWAAGIQPPPMLPLSLFRIRSFTAANAVTWLVYGSLASGLLLVPVILQSALGWTAFAAGASSIPITVILAATSSRVGALLPRVGPRLLLTLGSVLMGGGFAVLALISAEHSAYVTAVLLGILLVGCGLTLVVAPVTTTALGNVPVERSGVASGVNNAVARVAGLISIAVIPLLAGLSGSVVGIAAEDAVARDAVLAAYRSAMFLTAALCLLGAVAAVTLVPRRTAGSGPKTRDSHPHGR